MLQHTTTGDLHLKRWYCTVTSADAVSRAQGQVQITIQNITIEVCDFVHSKQQAR